MTKGQVASKHTVHPESVRYDRRQIGGKVRIFQQMRISPTSVADIQGTVSGEAAGEAVAVEYHAPFVFPFLGSGDGKLPGPPLRFVAGYNNTERSGMCPVIALLGTLAPNR